MASFRRVVRVAHVWLTASLTLFAGLPHVSCRCPDGHVKPFCLSFITRTTGCCGRDTCCSASRQEEAPGPGSPSGGPEKKSCCCHATRGTDSGPAGKARLGSQGCRRTLAETAPAIPGTEPTSGDHLAVGPFVPVPSTHLPLLPPAADAPRSWQSYRLPPPTDLVVTLQHFLI
jgi:hypothetical protein